MHLYVCVLGMGVSLSFSLQIRPHYPLPNTHQTIEGEWQAFLASLPAMALPTTEGGAHLKAEYERTLSPVVGSLLQQARKMVSGREGRRALVYVCNLAGGGVALGGGGAQGARW